MKFKDYHIAKELKERIEEMGYKRPTDIQYKAIPSILKSEDLLAIAQTGTGKTAAYAIPIVERVLKLKHAKLPTCVIMVPTHELAIQTQQLFQKLISKKRIRTLAIYGGVAQEPQIAQLQKGVDIVIATPGRLFDLQHQKALDLSALKILVLDEADHMLDLGFIKDIQDLIKRIPKNRQTLFFSATINKQIKKLAYSIVRNAIRIQISPKNPVAKSVFHQVSFVEMDDKRFFLERILNENPEKKVLVFVRTMVRAERVKKAMQRVGLSTQTIHRDKTQEERKKIIQEFTDADASVLISTDLSARGVDIQGINLVVNYDMPDKAENYVHRIGRTGRAKQAGYAISFCAKEELPLMQEIEEFIGKKVEVLKLGKQEYAETIQFSKAQNETWQDLMNLS